MDRWTSGLTVEPKRYAVGMGIGLTSRSESRSDLERAILARDFAGLMKALSRSSR